MLPELLVADYKQYKEDTKVIATWLSVTAKGLGYVSEALPTSPELITKPKKSKAKPKTKKQLRDAARRVPREQRQHAVSRKDFMPLAQYIVDQPNPNIPSSILSLVARVIAAREDFEDWFKANTQEDDKDGHLYFIQTLQDVYGILQPHVASNDKDVAGEGETLVDMSNLFEVLDLEEPSEEFLNASGPSYPSHDFGRLASQLMNLLTGELTGDFEKSLATVTLFRDINQICNHVNQVWCQYKDGKIDLMNAAIISNTAIELVRRLEVDFFEQYPRFRRVDEQMLKQYKRYDSKHADAQQLINFMYRWKCHQKKKKGFNSLKSDVIFNLDMFDDARYYFVDMLEIYCIFYTSSQSLSKCVYDAGRCGSWDPELVYEGLSNTAKHHQDRRILLELLPDMVLLSTSLSKIPSLAEDELLRASRNAFSGRKKEPKIHLWMLVSMRLFCDIHHVLGSDIGQPFEAIRKLGETAINAVEEATLDRASGKTEYWSKQTDESINVGFLDRIQQSLFVDEVKEYISNSARNVKRWKGKKSFDLLRHHPWACGLMEFNIRAGLEELGLVASHVSLSGVTTAHLYNALRKEAALRIPWPDMELFIDLLSTDQLFGGDRPSDPEEYCTRFFLLKGISAETFAHNRRDRGTILTKHDRRILSPKGGLLPFLKARYFATQGHPEMTDEDCTLFLSHLEENLNDRTSLVSDGKKVIVRTGQRPEMDSPSEAISGNRRKYSPVELLIALQFSLAQDLPKMMFDYLGFHKSCWEVLKSAYSVYGPFLEQEMPTVSNLLDIQQQHRLVLALDSIFALGMPFSKAQKMIRKVAMPILPARTHEFQQMFDQGAIFQAVGEAIESEMIAGRLKIHANVQARKEMEARPRTARFKNRTVLSAKDTNITFRDHKVWAHTDSRCTKSHCVCNVEPMPMLKRGWRRHIAEMTEKLFAEVEKEGLLIES